VNVEAIAAAAHVTNAVAVVITLIILVVTLRQNTRTNRVVAVDSLAAAIAAINVPAIESATVGAALERALTDWFSAEREQRIIAHYFLFSFFKLSENAWYQQKSGILDQAQWLGWEKLLRLYFHSPGVQQAWWRHRRNSYSVDFQRFLESTTPPAGLSGLGPVFDGIASDSGHDAPEGPGPRA
jgi:hypothetical protein